jgi:phosphoesterase RecJ-like protein
MCAKSADSNPSNDGDLRVAGVLPARVAQPPSAVRATPDCEGNPDVRRDSQRAGETPATLADSRGAVVAALDAARTIVTVTHIRPDADAIGCCAALTLAAAHAGKTATAAIPDVIPARYAFLLESCAVKTAADFPALAARADMIVVADTCSFAQLAPLAETLRAQRSKIVVIDHHATADDVADVVWKDTSAAAAGVMVTELLEQLGWMRPAGTVAALLAAIATDTGWFKHSNTDARALATAARLTANGGELNLLHRQLYQGDRPERLRLLAAALSSLEWHAAGRLAVMSLTGEDFTRTGAAIDETEDFVNEPLRVGAVEISTIIIQEGDVARVSLRSKSSVDVAAIARKFSGGGHARAAGCRIPLPLPAARQQVIDACVAALG